MRALALVAVLARVGSAEPWHAARGVLEPGRTPGSYLLAGDAAPAHFSEGEMISDAAIELPYRLDVVWRRLGPEGGRSMHVEVLGGVVLIKSGAIALYSYDEQAFSADGWRPLVGYDTHAEHAVTVVQDRAGIDVAIDGAAVAHFARPAPRTAGKIGLGMKGAPGFRTAIYVRSLALRHLQ